jgi:hypothetical protein
MLQPFFPADPGFTGFLHGIRLTGVSVLVRNPRIFHPPLQIHQVWTGIISDTGLFNDDK